MGKKKNFSCEEPSEASIADSIYLQRKAEEDLARHYHSRKKRLPNILSCDCHKLTRITSTRFSELQRGEAISSKEIKKRLRDIRNCGYETKSLEGMNKDESWRYLMQIRKHVREIAGRYCSDTLSEVDNLNKKQKEYC